MEIIRFEVEDVIVTSCSTYNPNKDITEIVYP